MLKEIISTSKNRGVSTVVGFSIILMMLIASYTYYQATVIPEICSRYELNHFNKMVGQLIEFLSELKSSCSTGKHANLKIDLGGNYPVIPFFSTPTSFSSTVIPYDGEIRIKNALALEEDLRKVFDGKEVVWKCNNLKVVPNYLFSSSSIIIYEYGVVGVGKRNYIPLSRLIEKESISLVLINCSIRSISNFVIERTLKCISGGGHVEIVDSGSPIEIWIKTKLPLDFWRNAVDRKSVESINKSGDYVILKLRRNKVYSLSTCIFDLTSVKQTPSYLIRISPKAQVSPCNLFVKVKDEYGNPVGGSNVRFESLNNSCILTNGTSSGFSVLAKSNQFGIAGIVVKECNGKDVIVSSLTRKDGTKYEVTFIVY